MPTQSECSPDDAYNQELLELVAIPSVSSLPDNLPDLRRAAAWLEARLKAAGLEVRRWRFLLHGCLDAAAAGCALVPAMLLLRQCSAWNWLGQPGSEGSHPVISPLLPGRMFKFWRSRAGRALLCMPTTCTRPAPPPPSSTVRACVDAAIHACLLLTGSLPFSSFPSPFPCAHPQATTTCSPPPTPPRSGTRRPLSRRSGRAASGAGARMTTRGRACCRPSRCAALGAWAGRGKALPLVFGGVCRPKRGSSDGQLRSPPFNALLLLPCGGGAARRWRRC